MSKLQDDLGLLDALKQQYRGEIAVAQANIKVYMANAAGIGEHPDVTGAIDEMIEKLATAQEKLNTIEGLFGEPTSTLLNG
jgi:2-hydroxychromene-2-carboxylate isomerase|tara:strand:+ start:3339 stop:3581 length:243 start_codon:yes stop_codon:yes gene_type:complete